MAGRPQNSTDNSLARAIRTARAKSKMSAVDAARRVGVSRAAWYHYESGARSPSLATLRRIAEVLGVRVERLIA